ncbi:MULTISPECIES: hypothetical protein [Aquitalea]|nr:MULTISPECIES: hypothetical protein [Aquitalea]
MHYAMLLSSSQEREVTLPDNFKLYQEDESLWACLASKLQALKLKFFH